MSREGDGESGEGEHCAELPGCPLRRKNRSVHFAFWQHFHFHVLHVARKKPNKKRHLTQKKKKQRERARGSLEQFTVPWYANWMEFGTRKS